MIDGSTLFPTILLAKLTCVAYYGIDRVVVDDLGLFASKTEEWNDEMPPIGDYNRDTFKDG